MALTLTITNAGRAALVNAANTGTAPVTLARIGISEAAHAPAATDTALPGEIRRIDTLSGTVVADDTIHVSFSDGSANAYTLRSIALYLADGTLFALYGQADPILVKTPASIAALSVDVTFADVAADTLTFGNAEFVNPPASQSVTGVVQLATLAQAKAGTDLTRALTPGTARAALPDWLAEIGYGAGIDADTLDGFHAADFVRLADFTGANQNGGPLSGYQKLPGGKIMQWGSVSCSRRGSTNITFMVAYPKGCRSLVASIDTPLSTTGIADVVSAQIVSTTQGRLILSSTGNGTLTVNWWAIGE